MNNMDKIAEILNINMNENFTALDALGEKYNLIFRLTEKGLESTYINNENNSGIPWRQDPHILVLLLSGEATIVRKPWKPMEGDTVFIINIRQSGTIVIDDITWDDTSSFCVLFYATGNCFKTHEEAEKYKDKFRDHVIKLRNTESDISWRYSHD